MNQNQRFFIDLHVIQTVPPSCVNRDDTGRPKTAFYGGVERARVSSQAWKHAMREYFKEIFAPEDLGLRTKLLPDMIAKAIMQLAPTITLEKAQKTALDVLKIPGIKTDDKKNQNAALFFISKPQIQALAELAVAGEKDKKAYQKALKDQPALDTLLFGRMVADDPSLNFDAAAQVAHAISTHEMQIEYDYFTAVDDGKKEDESGAGHLGTVEFNSATLYRYATLDVRELQKNLQKKQDVAKVVKGFVQAFVYAMPTGKQNTFANGTLPDMVYITVRGDQPVNLSGAFEKAIQARGGSGYKQQSCETLMEYAKKMYKNFAEEPEIAWGCGDEELFADVCACKPMKELLSQLEDYVAAQPAQTEGTEA